MMDLKTIDVDFVKATDPSQLLSAVRAGRPIKVQGLIDDWAAARWDFARLRALSGDREVTALRDLPRRGGMLEKGQDAYEQRMRFTDFLDLAENPERDAPCYLGYTRPDTLIPGYYEAFDFGPLTLADPGTTDTRLWIGSDGTCSGLHSDLKDNIFAQVHGTKRVVLVPFSQTDRVYPFVDNIVNSMVDPENFEGSRFPKFRKADIYRTRVEPGQVLHIPRGWWHYLRSESPSISVNHWFGQQIPARIFLLLLARLGPRYVTRTLLDAVRYGILKETYKKDFFFTPPSTGERLFNLIRHGDFSRENNPSLDS